MSRVLALWERLGLAQGALFGFALAVLMLWPGILYGPNALIGHPNLDVWSHAWGMSWFIERLSTFCLLYTSPSPRDRTRSRMPSSA